MSQLNRGAVGESYTVPSHNDVCSRSRTMSLDCCPSLTTLQFTVIRCLLNSYFSLAVRVTVEDCRISDAFCSSCLWREWIYNLEEIVLPHLWCTWQLSPLPAVRVYAWVSQSDTSECLTWPYSVQVVVARVFLQHKCVLEEFARSVFKFEHLEVAWLGNEPVACLLLFVVAWAFQHLVETFIACCIIARDHGALEAARARG